MTHKAISTQKASLGNVDSCISYCIGFARAYEYSIRRKRARKTPAQMLAGKVWLFAPLNVECGYLPESYGEAMAEIAREDFYSDQN